MLLASVIAAALAATPSLPATFPTTAPAPTSAPTSRPADQIMDDWNSTSQSLRALLPPPRELTSAEARAKVAPAVLPLLRKSLALTVEMYHANPSLPSVRSSARQHYFHILAIMAFLGDEPSIISLDRFRHQTSSENAPFARHAWYLTRWWPCLYRPADARKILDELLALATANPADDDLTSLLLQMREDLPAKSSLAPQVQAIIDHLTGPLARLAQDQFRFAEKRHSLLNKPLRVKAPTISGEPFTTQSLLGQTVILHFGLTTSPQWQTQHNALLQQFDSLPNKVTIVTILCDSSDEAIRSYMSQHKPIPWPVIRDKDDPSGFAAQYGVDQFPTSIVLGPDGTVSAVDVTPDSSLLDSLASPPTTAP